jgi:hypothetical protein
MGIFNKGVASLVLSSVLSFSTPLNAQYLHAGSFYPNNHQRSPISGQDNTHLTSCAKNPDAKQFRVEHSPGPIKENRYFPIGFFLEFRNSRQDEISYSPYALSYDNSGLVRNNARYSPYAVSYSNSGLVSDSTCPQQKSPYMILEYGPSNPSQQQPPKMIPRVYSPKMNPVTLKRVEDKKDLVLAFLREKKASDFIMDRGFTIGTGTVKTNFVSYQRKVIITYEDTDQTKNFQPYQQKMYDAYSLNLSSYLNQKKQEGFKLFQISPGIKEGMQKNLEAILKN